MNDWNTLKEHAMGCRRGLVALLQGQAEHADVVPPTWRNNLRWHAGHLLTTPHMLTYGLLGEPLIIPDEYRKWFAKGTSPEAWGDDPIPAFDDLVAEIVPVVSRLFDSFDNRRDVPFPRPYMTSLGIELRTPAEAFSFSMIHDGIHFGMIQALKRGLTQF